MYYVSFTSVGCIIRTMAPLHKICIWLQIRKIKRKSLMRDSDWLKINLRLIFLICVQTQILCNGANITWNVWCTPRLVVHMFTRGSHPSHNHDSILSRIHTALLWQKEASDKCAISCKRAKCVCHLHWCQWNIMMSYLTYLLAGWVFMHKIWPGRRAH